jgi:hypothetical protein
MQTEDIKQAEEFLASVHNRIDHAICPRISVTSQEWDEIRNLVATHGFPCEPIGHGMGFAICIRKHSDLPDVKPDKLLFIDQMQFPEVRNDEGRILTQLEAMAELTHSERNITTLGWYGIKRPSDLESYSY